MNLTLLAAAGGALVSFGLSALYYRSEIASLELQRAQDAQHAAQRLATKTQEYRDIEKRYIVRANDAAFKQKEELTSAKFAADSALAELGRLRQQLARATGLPATAESAATSHPIDPAAVAAVLSECGGELQALAAKADGHATDLKMMQAAWPQ